MYKHLIFPILSKFDPEFIHYFTMGCLRTIYRLPGGKAILRLLFDYSHPSLETEFAGIKFKNPVGLAAGFDKNGRWIDELATLGFGFVEVGTVTPKAQDGNPKPRLFRLKPDQALINRMGFNNDGIDALVENLKKRKSSIVVGGNLGKNKITDNSLAVRDYLITFKALRNWVDYFVVNVSSPNTPGLRELQEKGPLLEILNALQKENGPNGKPIFLKIAPDLSYEQLDDIIEIIQESGIAGIIATNTTLSRANLKSKNVEEIGAGGLSGKPLKERSTEVIRYIKGKSEIPVIGVGGIHTPEDAEEKFSAGASLIQVYSGFIYEGPGLIKRINKSLVR
ncbi:quinone-dependent dihydroorotate dehydrogenase [Leadbetterella byssophila]|uniref:Dihydroorotate dehydrogenase (quinone) n=1 Tax=Leadbetterella byssophila (strain DSM 17132 / JCM 16389 / KACC 11308 / NBRC 106382 / 4M15) TaxID=649349 RepID=E4RQU3_LEAB4|nr:quinone-dependent dihydroorotate dehydrogenase [Leadbetterella byssophila]ADQ18386.1 dihydroorotate dehydrogenase [Leadbetterella byssophila DSM 17132]